MISTGQIRFILPSIIILGSFLFFLFQMKEILVFDENFTLSRYLFGGTYEGVGLIDVGFDKKLEFIERGSTELLIAFFFVCIGLLIWSSFQGKKIEIVLVSLTAIAFLIYFFPEGHFARARFLILLFSLVIAGGANVTFRICETIFEKSSNSLMKKKSKLIAAALVLLIFIPVLYDSITPFVDAVSEASENKVHYSTWEPYEYYAAKWIRVNVPQNTLIVSDPFTTILMTQLTGLKPPYERKWVEEKEYPDYSLSVMSDSRSKFFDSSDPEERLLFINKLITSSDVDSALIIINQRTIQWLYLEKLIHVTYTGIAQPLSLYDVGKFLNKTPVQPLYLHAQKIFVLELNATDYPSIKKIFEGKKDRVSLWLAEADGKGNIDIPIISVDYKSKSDNDGSLKISAQTGDKANWRIFRDFLFEEGKPQDWSKYEALTFDWYGLNSGKTLRIVIATATDNWSNSNVYDFTENWTGNKRFVLNLKDPAWVVGSPDLSQVTRIAFSIRDNGEGERWIGGVQLGIFEEKSEVLSEEERKIITMHTLT